MTLRLRNTLTRRIEPVEPLEPGVVRMYTCGPTVYRYAHVGNLRSYLLADLIRRVLLYHGLAVRHVKNITDVGHLRDERFDRGEDRMLVAAGLEHKSPAEIARAYEAAFHQDEAAVNILPADVFPRATEHIPEMVALAERLVDAGHAYVSEAGNVYYAVASFAGYGALSGNSLDELRAGHRGDVDADKRDAADFALWKAAGEGRMLRWSTPRWGEGFPGWHLECSAMALRHLGERFDIHTGGIDNVFPHHEDEIAQSAPLVGGPPARHWVHGEHLLMGGRKMAKSAGNFIRLTELPDGVEPLAFRYLALGTRYARKLNFTDASIRAAAAGLESLRRAVHRLGPPPADGPWAPPPPIGTTVGLDRSAASGVPLTGEGRRLHDRFVAAVDDDLDLPAALAVVRQIVRAPLAPDEARWLLLDADAVLGLNLDRGWSEPSRPSAEVVAGAADRSRAERLLAERAAARSARDFATADALRAEIEGLGWTVMDGSDGSRLERR